MYHAQSSNSFPMLFSMANEGEIPASVDCTLSLGTPSTRLSNDNNALHHDKKRSFSNFGWNILPSKPSSAPKPHRAGAGDPLLARRCANCDTTSTPLWRNGPRGPKSLCNACGIRYKKEERRATAAAATSHGGGGQAQKGACYSAAYGGEYRFMEEEVVDHQHQHHHHRDSEIPFMSWRFNVTDRPSLVHDFTR